MIQGFDKKTFFELIDRLAKTPGPSLGESPRRSVLENYFTVHKVPYRVDSVGNVWVSHCNGAWVDAVVFDAHLDVVQDGYTETIDFRDGKICGLGVGDNLTAVTLLAMFAVHVKQIERQFQRPLFILFSIGEEGEGNLKGVRQVVMDHEKAPHAFISFDLAFEEYSLAGLGSMRYAVDLTCPGGHSWSDYGIPSAIDLMMTFLQSMKNKALALTEEKPGCLSFNIGSIQGGEGINSIARSAGARFEFRSSYPHWLDQMDAVVSEHVAELNHITGVRASCSLIGHRPAAQPVCPERLEPHVLKILTGLGENPRPVIRSTNINATLNAGWPSICLGLCEGGRFHSHEEFVVIDSIQKGWTVLGKLADSLLTT